VCARAQTAKQWLSVVFSRLSRFIPRSSYTLIGATIVYAYVVYEHLTSFWEALPRVTAAAAGKAERVDLAAVGGVTAVASAFLWPLYSSRMLPTENRRIMSGGSCWADLPIHMHIVEAFLSGRNQDVSWGGMHSPVFAGESLAYPFMPDFHAAVMMKLGGVSMRTAFLLPGFALALSLFALMFLFTLRLSRSHLGGVLAILLLVGAGGMGGWNLAARDGFWNAVQRDTAQNDSVGADGRIVWFAFLPHVLMPQRGANFAYPLNLSILTFVWRATDSADKAVHFSHRRELLFLSAGLAGLLPLVQAHAFVAMACIIGVMGALDFHKWLADPRLLAVWAQAGALALLAAYPQIRLFRHQVESGAAGQFIKYGMWYANHEVGQPAGVRGFFNFWWSNTGPALSLFLVALAVYGADAVLGLAYAARVAASAPAHAMEDVYEATVPVPVWSSVTNRAVKAEASGLVDEGGSFAVRYSAAERVAKRRLIVDADAAATAGTMADAEGAGERPTSPQMLGGSMGSVELRIASLEMEYTLPAEEGWSGGKDGSNPPRFKLELPSGPSAIAPTVIVSHVGGGSPETGFAAMQSGGTFMGPGSGTFAPGPSSGSGAGAHPSDGAPPAGARVAKAFDPEYELRDSKVSVHFSAHVWAYAKVQVAHALGVHVDDLFDPARYSITGPDRVLWLASRLSLTGRAFDAFKLGLGAGLVFFVGNYVNFQPWDRDNCKLFYVWISVSSCLVGPLLAAPFEFLVEAASAGALTLPGTARMLVNPFALVSSGLSGYGQALYSSRGSAALPRELYPAQDRLVGVAAPVDVAAVLAKKTDDVRAAVGKSTGPRLGSLPAASVWTGRAVSIALALLGPWVLAKATLTGFMMIAREYGQYNVLLDEEQIDTGAWIKEHVAPKAVLVMKDGHITPSGCLAGRPSLISYTGWMWSHGCVLCRAFAPHPAHSRPPAQPQLQLRRARARPQPHRRERDEGERRGGVQPHAPVGRAVRHRRVPRAAPAQGRAGVEGRAGGHRGGGGRQRRRARVQPRLLPGLPAQARVLARAV
jgi:hypothetical protein